METNVLGLLTEALTAQVKVVLADQTSLVLADAAKENVQLAFVIHCIEFHRSPIILPIRYSVAVVQ